MYVIGAVPTLLCEQATDADVPDEIVDVKVVVDVEYQRGSGNWASTVNCE
jgi:hypothetical protein